MHPGCHYRFEFCTLSGEVADIQGAPKVDAEKLEGLAASVGPALDDFLAEHDLPGNHSKVKVRHAPKQSLKKGGCLAFCILN